MCNVYYERLSEDLRNEIEHYPVCVRVFRGRDWESVLGFFLFVVRATHNNSARLYSTRVVESMPLRDTTDERKCLANNGRHLLNWLLLLLLSHELRSSGGRGMRGGGYHDPLWVKVGMDNDPAVHDVGRLDGRGQMWTL